MITKGDIVKLATVLMVAYEEALPAQQATVECITHKIADVIAAGNPNFDRARFMRAAIPSAFKKPVDMAA